MSVTRADREASLKKRYAGRVAAAPKRRGMGRGPGPGAPRGGGRPKSTGAALKRLMSYLEADRLRMGIAFFCVIVNTVLEDGKIIGHGTHEELLKTCETYSEIYTTQIGNQSIGAGEEAAV